MRPRRGSGSRQGSHWTSIQRHRLLRTFRLVGAKLLLHLLFPRAHLGLLSLYRKRSARLQGSPEVTTLLLGVDCASAKGRISVPCFQASICSLPIIHSLRKCTREAF